MALTSRVPLMMSRSGDYIILPDDRQMRIDYVSIGPGYFDALRLPLVRGRAFERTDDAAAPRVAVINETLARRGWPDGDALGSTFLFRGQPTTVVGVARDARYATLDEDVPGFVYLPLRQVWHPTQTLLVRSQRGEPEVMREVREMVLALDPALPSPPVATLKEYTDLAVLPQRAGAFVTSGLGIAGLLLASIGLYGVMAFAVGRRTREIGIRVALGATRGSVLRLMLGHGLRLVLIGIASGLVLAAVAGRAIAPYLFAVSPVDPLAFVGMSAVLGAVALAASYLPARRAAAANPLDALRGE